MGRKTKNDINWGFQLFINTGSSAFQSHQKIPVCQQSKAGLVSIKVSSFNGSQITYVALFSQSSPGKPWSDERKLLIQLSKQTACLSPEN